MDENNQNHKSQMPQSALKRSDERFGEDRISELHDSLLSYILSLMSTRNAVSTSVLSRRWRNIWKSVPKLQLNSGNFRANDEFLDFVDRVMSNHSTSCLQKFSLKYDSQDHNESRFKDLFNNLVDAKVQHVDVMNCLSDHVRIPVSIFSCQALTALELNNVCLDVPELVSLPSLKILNIREVEFVDSSAFMALISGCPVLEEAYITRNNWDNLDAFYLSSESLKKLCLFNMNVDFPANAKVVIHAPNLEYLCLAGQPFHMLKIYESEALVEADIDVLLHSNMSHEDFRVNFANVIAAIYAVKEQFQGNADHLLAEISRARSLTLSAETLLVFRAYRLQTTFANLTYLDIEFFGDTLQLLLPFLHRTPNLKTLIVGEVTDWVGYNLEARLVERRSDLLIEVTTFTVGDTVVALQDELECFISSLEYFELRSVKGRPIEVNLLKHILKAARVLKKVIIHVNRDFQIQRRKLIQLLNELRSFRKEHHIHHPCQIIAVREKERVMAPQYKNGKFSLWDE